MPSSLHFHTPNQPSSYATAIEAVGNIIQDYDTCVVPHRGKGGGGNVCVGGCVWVCVGVC